MRPSYLILLLVTILSSLVHAQQLPVYQHSFLIRSAYNPAEVLNEQNEISIYALRGNQFQKFQGGFVNNYANFSTPLDNMNIGLGLDMASRTYGPINQLSIGLAYAYRVRFDKFNSLIFGARLGFMEHKFNNSLINPYHENDPTIMAIPAGNIIPNGNFGLTLRTKIGVLEVSVPQLLSNRFLNPTGNDIQSITLHPHLFSRYSIDINVIPDMVKLSPIVSIRYLPGTIAQFEAGMTALFNKSLWVNANIRSTYSASIGVGIVASENWTIGYSYDRPIINRFSFNANNHEVVLGYTFQRGRSKLPAVEWNQTQTEPKKMKMDSISPIQDVTMAEEFLKYKLANQLKTDSINAENVDPSRSGKTNYKNILVEVNLVDSLFESAVNQVETSEVINSKSNKIRKDDKITQTDIDNRIKRIEENVYLEKLNENSDSKIKIVRNEQPSEKYFVELSGEDSPSGYYLITGVFSTLERAQNFRWKSDSEMSKIIINKKNNYFYVVYSYSESKSLKELEQTLNEYRSKNQKIWILDY